MTRLSYSKITDFVQCPRRYWLSHIKCLPLEQNKYLIAGKETHEILHQSTMVDDWKGFILSHPKYQEYKQSMDNYIVYQEKLIKAGGNPVPEFAEMKYRDEELDFSLVVDRIDEFNGKRLLIDYKTDGTPIEGKHDKQLLLYTHFFNKLHPHTPITHYAPFFVKARKGINVKPVDNVEVMEAVDWLLRTKWDIENRGKESNMFPCKPDKHCNFCSHRLSFCCKQGMDYMDKICQSVEITDDVKEK